MKYLLPFLLLFLTSRPAHARLGETLDECQARYGVLVKVDIGQHPEYPQYVYQFKGVEIRVRLLNGRSAQETFSAIEGGKLTQAQEDEIRNSNRGERYENDISHDYEFGIMRVMTPEFRKLVTGTNGF